ncbi:hypothetical protein KO527_05260 [Pseudoalteromonas sp. C2R02]|uniref:hypothetical protein n=1 Tax=Pseudoalteromonas sp. C2R02 TaxID=2841565 RepID=UPI001C0820A6|nr:hypothetical protein [Pseudoalteromonas sp. C2R02]MBU2968756.1 hypothetical protein [Pseudoalteromonas sp. C2R02]
MENKSIAFRAGVKAAELGVPLGSSGLVNLHPDSDRYDQFIDGYESVKQNEECDCEALGSECSFCEVDD